MSRGGTIVDVWINHRPEDELDGAIAAAEPRVAPSRFLVQELTAD